MGRGRKPGRRSVRVFQMLLGSVAEQASDGMSESDAWEPDDASDGGYEGILAGDELGGGHEIISEIHTGQYAWI